MAVAKAKTQSRAQVRPEPEARTPERPARPDQILTRDGRPVDLARVTRQNDDYTNLAAIGIFPPKGWVYQWRTVKVKGADYHKGIVNDGETGWTPVPASRHPGKLMALGHDGPIMNDDRSQMLMERDERLEAMAVAERNRAANAQLHISRSMTGLLQRTGASSAAFDAIADFNHNDVRGANFVRTEREARTSDAKYDYSLDE